MSLPRFARATVRLRSSCPPRLPRARTYFWSSPAVVPAALAFDAFPSIAPDLTPYLLALVLSSTAVVLANDVPSYKVSDLRAEGKGLGAIATREIERGEIILSERPLAVWEQGLTSKKAAELFEGFSKDQKDVFMGLCMAEGLDDEVLSRRAANGFSVQLPTLPVGMDVPGFPKGGAPESEGQTLSFIFAKVSRFNHSCLPNASQAMSFESLRMEIYAITSIPPQTEILIEYLPNLTTKTRAERRELLKTSFGFSNCLCRACTAEEEEGLASDRRRTEIGQLVRKVESVGGRKDKVEWLERIRVLLKTEGYIGPPEFDSPTVSNAYLGYLQMQARLS